MALQKVFVIDDDKSSEVSTILSFLDYKVKLLTLDKLKAAVNIDDSPLVVLAEGVDVDADVIHAFFAERKRQQPFLYIHNNCWVI